MRVMKQEINNCLNDIDLESDLRTQVMDTTDAEARIKSYNNKILRNRARKKIGNFIAIFVLFFVMTNTTIYAVSEKSIFDVFFSKNNKYKAMELLDYNGQTYVIDDYTFELDQTLYDSGTGHGYLVFIITKEGGKPEISLNSSNQCVGGTFGEDERFCFKMGVTYDDNYEYIGDKLFAYISYEVVKKEDYYISLIDYKDGEPKEYSFTVKETSNVKSYHFNKNKGGELFISPLGIAIYPNDDIENYVITLYMKDGTKKEVINVEEQIGTGGATYRISRFKGKIEYCRAGFRFRKMFDISEIDKIEVNGEILE